MEEIAYLDGGRNDQLSSIPSHFYESADNHPDTVAIISVHQQPIKLPGISPENGQPRLSWTYKQLKDASDSLAERLSSLGVCKGTPIAIFSHNRAEWGLFFWAAVRLGCPFVPLNPATIASVNDLQYILSLICPGVVVLESQTMATDLEENAPEEMSHVFLKVTLDELENKYVLHDRHPEYHQSEDSQPDSASKNNMDKKEYACQTIGWIHLPDLWPPAPETYTFPKREPRKLYSGTLLVLFTSGTTSFPKACPLSDVNLRIFASYLGAKGLKPGWRSLMHAPPYHSFASVTSVCSWCNGFTIVYPSATFNVLASLDAAESERCQSMPAVPAMINAFNLIPEVAQRKLSSIETIDLGAAPVTPEIVGICQNVLKIPEIGAAWAMTENPAPIINRITQQMTLNRDEFVPVGQPMYGTKAKICAPNTTAPLKRNIEGELHVGGPQVIRGYLNPESDNFYEDEGTRWIITGDMASIHDDGMVRIIGRRKDIIIRGGVNIAPAIIELKLNTVHGVECQVVGLPDEMAGEIPIAVIRLTSSAADDPAGTIASLQEIALRDLGPKSAPAQYLDLNRDLKLDAFPATFSGKIKKNILLTNVQEYFSKTDEVHRVEELRNGSTKDLVCRIWSQISGVPSAKLNNAISIFALVDSITTMRFCSAIRKELRKNISVIDIMKFPTIDDQVQFIESLSNTATGAVAAMQKRKGPPTAGNIAHCRGDEQIANEIQSLSAPILTKLGLDWNRDVEDVMTAPDTLSIYLTGARPQTWNQRMIYIARNTSRDQLLTAWKATVSQHPLMRCLAIDYPEDLSKLLVVIRDADAWWSCSLYPNLTVSDAEELRSAFPIWADPTTGPLVRVGFVDIANAPQDSALVFVACHAVFDNMSANAVFEDLVTAIEKKVTPEGTVSFSDYTPFKLYADFYHRHRTGKAAQLAVDYHVQRLQGIGKFASALWPPSRAPGWFKGGFTGWRIPNGEAGEPESRKPLDSGSSLPGLDGLTRTAKVPEIDSLREQYGIKPYAILKAAVALYNIHETGQTMALFAGLEAARYWPFMPADPTTAQEEQLLKEPPDPLTIAGPMFETVVNVIHVTDTNEKSKNLWVPKAMLRYEKYYTISPPDDQTVVKGAIRRQIWNWPLGIQTQAQTANSDKDTGKSGLKVSFEKFSRASYDDVGLAWTCGLWDQETFYLNASYDDCQLSKDEAFTALGKVLSATAWLAAHLENDIGEISFNYGDVGGLIASLE